MSEKSLFSSCVVGLLVIRSNDMEQAARFYSALGLKLTKHSHPPCGDHYSTADTDCVFEIYQRKNGQATTTPLVFGFNVSSVDGALEALVAQGGKVKRVTEDVEWGRTAVVTDLDGHSVFLIQKP